MRFLPWLLAGLLLVKSGLATTSPATRKPTRSNIIVITLDTTRADRMGFLGSKLGLTPNLDALAKQSAVFTHAYSHVPLTTASHATIFTGTYPQFNHVVDFGIPLSDKLPYTPEILHKIGYHTAAFVASLVLDPLGGTAPGFDRGFDVYDAGFRLRPRGADRYKTVERRAEEVINHCLTWLSKRPSGSFLLWVHLYDAHDPYDPPEPFNSRYASQPYDGEIAYVDAQVGRFLNALRAKGLYDSSLIAVMADHGESLGEHGENTHGVFLYDSTIHVPLLIKLPGLHREEKQIDTRVDLVDVAPTILGQAGLFVPKEMQGESLLPFMRRAKVGETSIPDRAAYAETDYPHRAFGWSPLRALRTGKYLYIRAPQPELYNQTSDPAERQNLVANSKAVADTVATQLENFRKKTSQTLVELAKPDPEMVEKLRALGYVATDTNNSGSSANHSEIDPKSKIEVSNLLHDAMLDVEDAQYQRAVPLLEKVLVEQPEMPIAEMQLGIAQARLKNYDKALPHLRKAVQVLPDSGMGHYELGLALYETGDWKGAAPEFEAAVQKAPRWADAHFSLASVYARIDRVSEAMTELDTTLTLNPDHYRGNLLRGRILSLQNIPDQALPNLQKAAEVQPSSMEAHLFLADAYAQLGRQQDAMRERQEASRLKANPTDSKSN